MIFVVTRPTHSPTEPSYYRRCTTQGLLQNKKLPVSERPYIVLGRNRVFFLNLAIFLNQLLHTIQRILSIPFRKQRIVIQPLISVVNIRRSWNCRGLLPRLAYNSYNAKRSSYSFFGSDFGINRWYSLKNPAENPPNILIIPRSYSECA